MTFTIYMIECPEGRRYVGCTSKTPETRLAQFAIPPRPWPGDGRAEMIDAVKRFGREAMKVSVLATAESREDAAFIEGAMIERYGSLQPNGYNRHARSGYPRNPYSGRHWTAMQASA